MKYRATDCAQEDRRCTVREVLLGWTADQRSSDSLVVRLLPLSLSDRVVGEHDESFAGQIRRQQLPGRLARVPVPHRHQNRGMASRTLGTIEVCGHVILRQALEQHVIDDEPVALRRPGDPRVEWPPIFRQAADQRQHALAHLLLTRLRGRGVTDGRHRLRAFTQLPLRDRIQLDEDWGPGLLGL